MNVVAAAGPNMDDPMGLELEEVEENAQGGMAAEANPRKN